MKKILGLDLGSNSIGWALIEQEFENKSGKIVGMGSRILPMDQGTLGKFAEGAGVSQTADRTQFRGVRRLRERHLLRRERLHRVLNQMNFLPCHYARQIDFDNRLGQFLSDVEPKIAYMPVKDESSNIVSFDFIFKDAFEEMLEQFKLHQPLLIEGGKKIPFDWTIYYLRNKALHQKITKEELSWIILNFNQKRGYYQLRGEEAEEAKGKLVEFHALSVVDVVADSEPSAKGDLWYSLHLENGWVYRRSSKVDLSDWKGKIKEFVVTTELDDDGLVKVDKEGRERRSFRSPGEDDWTLVKEKTQKQIRDSGKTVGEYIYSSLLTDPSQKIRGKLVKTIERKFYKEELERIITTQMTFHEELRNQDLYNACVRELYRTNSAYQIELSKKDFLHLFVNDIIFYQRPLKSKKSSISDCNYEFKDVKMTDKHGNVVTRRLYNKAVPKSHSLYQEFRVWQWLQNLKILEKESGKDVTADFLKTLDDRVSLFDFLMEQDEVNHKNLIEYLLLTINDGKKPKKAEVEKYTWNYVYDSDKNESKSYPCNTTGHEIRKRFKKIGVNDLAFLTPELEHQLWHIIYSVTDKEQFEAALKTFAKEKSFDSNSFVEEFKKFPPFKSEYGSFSLKAIKKLLPLMRSGRYWSWDSIDQKTQDRIQKLTTAEFDENIINKLREKTINLSKEDDYQGLPLWLAEFIVYDKQSGDQWKSIAQLDHFIESFKQHSLRNPIVEQVVLESLRVVKDIWSYYGKSRDNFFDEIHLELGRDLKNTADERKRLTQNITANEATNIRIKLLLAELQNNSDGKLTVDGVRSYSPMQQEALRIYEEGVLGSLEELPEEVLKISKTAQPSTRDLQRYRLWLDQKYRSPYTGQPIPLSKLFTEAYQIEHIIPQSRFFDDSMNNKVLCEAAVNQLKDKMLGMEFINEYGGQMVELGQGAQARLFNPEAYQKFVKESYAKNRSKRDKLLMEDIPDQMIQRQMNDTRYISKFIAHALSNIVRSDEKDEELNSKNLIPITGKITTRLKQDWGLEAVWNDLILPRFQRMNAITNSDAFTTWNERYQKYLPTVPIELAKGFQKKRIDHRHHAMDALVVACATRDHVNLLNNEAAKSNKRHDLNRKLRVFEKAAIKNQKTGEVEMKSVPKDFIKPWESFTTDAKDSLEQIIVSFKQNLRVINKTTNKYESFKDEDGKLRLGKDGQPKKGMTSQTKGDSWAIRKPMHKDTVFGAVSLKKKKEVALNIALEQPEFLVDKKLKAKVFELIALKYDKRALYKFFKDKEFVWNNANIARVEVYYWEHELVASRVSLDTSFDRKRIVNSVTDSGIQKILLNHLDTYSGRLDEKGKEISPELLAFTPEGVEDMNKNICALNNGKPHKPIYKIRTYEPRGNKFSVGKTGNKSIKFVEAAKGTNLFFAIYEDENGKRNYETIPLNEVIEHQKWKAGLPKEERANIPDIPINPQKGSFLFYLSPNDLVYLPASDISEKSYSISGNRVCRFTDSSATTGNFMPANAASLLFDMTKKEQEKLGVNYFIQNEFGVGSPQSKNQRSIDGQMIKEVCNKLEVDRLGIIRLIINKPHISYLENDHISIENLSQVEEDFSIYQTLVVRPLTLQEQADEMTQYSASLTPLERLQYLKQLIKIAYGEKAKEPDNWITPIKPKN
jgi:CRISPR-associated endonuclease Csn1